MGKSKIAIAAIMIFSVWGACALAQIEWKAKPRGTLSGYERSKFTRFVDSFDRTLDNSVRVMDEFWAEVPNFIGSLNKRSSALVNSLVESTESSVDELTKSDAPDPSFTQLIDRRMERFHSDADKGPLGDICDDATFLRRISLDLSGRIPTVAQLRDFTESPDQGKRNELIDRLLNSDRFAQHTARIWRRILIQPNAEVAERQVASLDKWLEQQIHENAGFDKIARELVTAGGAESKSEPPADSAAYHSGAASSLPYLVSTGGQPAEMASSVSRVFLGVKLECAMCHDHPFTDWSQDDFWGVAAFFSGTKLQNSRFQFLQREDQASELVDTRLTGITDTEGNHYNTSLPWFDGNVDIPKGELPRRYFANWLTAKENPHFSATIVNRVWQQLCGSGLTDSVEDLDQATQDQRDVVLDLLAEEFAKSSFDLRNLIRSICASKYDQRTSDLRIGNVLNPRPLKVLTPDQLFDSLEVALGLPISSIDRGPRFNGTRDSLLARMEEAVGSRPDDFRSGIPQTLALMNGLITAEATDLKKGNTLRAVVDAPFLDLGEKISVLFLASVGREPGSVERETFVDLIESKTTASEQNQVLSEILWALINSPEFVLVR